MSYSSAFNLEDDDNLRRVLYVCAFVLFFLPYSNAFLGIWPLHLGDVRWRFTAAGTMSGILMLPFIGMSLGLAIARACGHKGISRLIGVMAALTFLGALGGMGLFFLDALQVKSIVRDAAMTDFMKAVATATVSLGINILAYALLTFTAFRSPKGAVKAPAKSSGSKKAATEEPVGLLIGQDYTKQ